MKNLCMSGKVYRMYDGIAKCRVVIVPKYRKGVLYGKVKRDVSYSSFLPFHHVLGSPKGADNSAESLLLSNFLQYFAPKI
jgi:hypothetical protein